ncbi:D-sedoheptulose-7-phosphate isomerase [Roseomonas marmotae]|nr:SIS domain-containing protein [Roseomonas marmotae]
MSEWNSWLGQYFDLYRSALATENINEKLVAFHDLCLQVRERKGKLMFAGNGASASIASHGAVDFTKQGRVRAMDFNEPNLITCLSNDFGFENFMAKAVEFYADDGDVLVLISVSGKSPNAVAAAEYARSRGLKVVSFTGSASDNPLRGLSDIDFWLGSRAYNVVEGMHNIWLTTVVDMLVGKAEYAVA